MSQSNTEQFIEEQQKVAQLIRSLKVELKELQRAQRAAGWAQRNAVISHVYSDYNQQKKVLEKRKRWENITFKCDVLQGILKLLLPHRDIYGFYDVLGMERELANLLTSAEKRDEFEIAKLINQYSIKFCDARVSDFET